MPTEDPVPEVADPSDLYTLPLNQFTPARDLLARSLRSQDRTDEAETVGKLRKPSVAAWALNRAARSHPELVESLRKSHQKLREAGSVAEMQAASETRRHAVSALLEEAVGELRAEGRTDSPQTRDRINSTLLAIATDPEGETELEEGRLVRELEPSGAGWGEMGLTPVPVDPRRSAVAAAGQARSRADRLAKELADAERQLEIAERAVKEARRRAKQARARAEEASAEAARAEEAAGEDPSKE
jgi:hypothetical protein